MDDHVPGMIVGGLHWGGLLRSLIKTRCHPWCAVAVVFRATNVVWLTDMV